MAACHNINIDCHILIFYFFLLFKISKICRAARSAVIRSAPPCPTLILSHKDIDNGSSSLCTLWIETSAFKPVHIKKNRHIHVIKNAFLLHVHKCSPASTWLRRARARLSLRTRNCSTLTCSSSWLLRLWRWGILSGWCFPSFDWSLSTSTGVHSNVNLFKVRMQMK